VRLDEGALAELVYAGGDPTVYRALPSALAAARDHDLAALRRMVTQARLGRAKLIGSPEAARVFSVTQSFATMCHDYPRLFSFADALPVRQAAYRRALTTMNARQFAPFSPVGWMRAGFESGDACIHWPGDPAAPATTLGPLPDVPTLVVSGDLDANTPSLAGRQTARQFPHATWVEIPNVGHTPTAEGCGLEVAAHFVRTLHAQRHRCAVPR
jgi:pimeloyl-ACP methyl ester carboxylesterase